VVYVTHDQGEALALSSRIAVTNKGRIVQIGTPREIYEKPKSLFGVNGKMGLIVPQRAYLRALGQGSCALHRTRPLALYIGLQRAGRFCWLLMTAFVVIVGDEFQPSI
jgi:hypothetical protein